MEQEELNQDNPSLLNNNMEDQSLRKPLASSGGGGDRLKRDEWSEGAVSSLLDAYESKWVLRNRAKLKGHDWEDVARFVSSRANSTKSPKTQTQCKNKIESMKKRYRSESVAAEASSWPLFQRLDLLLRCRTNPPATPSTCPIVLLDQLPPPPPPPPTSPPAPPPPTTIGIHQNSQESNGVEPVAKEEGVGAKTSEGGSDKVSMEMDSSTPVSHTMKEKLKMKKMKVEKKDKKKKKRRGRDDWEVVESIRWLAEVVVRSEQVRMDTMKEVERMRVEAEAKRGEMDLKRTEIIANTQLQIAQLLAGNGKGIDSSLRIGRN